MNRLHAFLGALGNRRFLKWIVVPHAIFFAVAWWTDAPDLIAVLNPVTIALSVAVCVAFLPSVLDAIWGVEPFNSAAFMILGVFWGWYGNGLRQAWSMVWRALGAPEWLANTDFTSYVLFILSYGAVCHLLAPGAIGEQVPRHSAVKVGLWVGVGVFVGMSFAYRDTLFEMVQHFHPPHDVSTPL